MHIGIITPGYSASDDDWCIPVLQDLCCSLGTRHRVSVFTLTYPHESKHYAVKGVPVRSFGNGRAGRLALFGRMRKAIRAIADAHRGEPFDILHGFWPDQGGLVAALAGRALSISSCVTAMAGELIYEPGAGYGKRRRPLAGFLAREGARRADLFLVNSAYHARRLRLEQPKLSPLVHAFGIDTARFSDDGPALVLAGEPPVVCAASLVPVKGHEVLLKALANVRSEGLGVHLHLLGTGPLETPLLRIAERLGLADCVTFHGHVEHDQVSRYYRGAAFCVLPSYFEGQGMVVLEAAACGRMTIGSAVGAMADFCPPEFLHEPGDVTALTAALRVLAGDVERARELGQQLVPAALQGCSIERSVAALERLYEQEITTRPLSS